MIIPGIKLIRHNSAGINNPDDESFPHKLVASFRPPEFMEMAHVSHMFLYGNEEIVARGMTKEALEQFSEVNCLKDHPRLIRLTIT